MALPGMKHDKWLSLMIVSGKIILRCVSIESPGKLNLFGCLHLEVLIGYIANEIVCFLPSSLWWWFMEFGLNDSGKWFAKDISFIFYSWKSYIFPENNCIYSFFFISMVSCNEFSNRLSLSAFLCKLKQQKLHISWILQSSRVFLVAEA